jgi:mono/diheme cytochrome c family protein
MSKRAGFPFMAGGLLLVSAIVAGGGNSVAQQIGNAEQGRRLAKADCAQCHRIDRNSYSSNLEAPAFDDIANVPGMTERALTVALQTSHRSMPNFVIKGRDTEDLVAYILSLKRK